MSYLSPQPNLRFGPLIAITLFADILATVFLSTEQRFEAMFGTWLGLAFGQLSVGCVWSTFAERHDRLRWLLTYVGGFVLALILALRLDSPSQSNTSLAIIALAFLFWLHVTVLFGFLWFVKQAHTRPIAVDASSLNRWQISMQQMMIVTAVLSVVLVAGVNSTFFSGEDMALLGPLTLNNVGIAVAAVSVWRWNKSCFWRIPVFAAIVVAFWLAFSASMSWLVAQPLQAGLFLTMSIVEATVLLLWLSFDAILPRVNAQLH